jgi:BlaI family transcriptional regulator, penicillinase repressor
MSRKPVELTEGEWAIIKAVWQHQPCTAPDIQEALAGSKGWVYTTVRTTMDRMAAKGLLATEKIRHMTLYRSAITREQAQQGDLLYTLKHAFDNALTPMLQCMLQSRQLSDAELAELESLLRQTRKQTGKRG